MTEMTVAMTSNQYAMDPKHLWSEKEKEQRDQSEIPSRNETQQGPKKPENHMEKDTKQPLSTTDF